MYGRQTGIECCGVIQHQSADLIPTPRGGGGGGEGRKIGRLFLVGCGLQKRTALALANHQNFWLG